MQLKRLRSRAAGMLLAAFLLFSLPALSAPHGCNRTTVFYVNGVFNFQQADAEESARGIRAALQANGVNDAASLRIRTVWNPGSGLGDLEEVGIEQSKLLEYLAGTLRFNPTIAAWVAVITGELDLERSRVARRRIIDGVKSELLKVVKESKTPIVVVAHSQGNIYVNAAILELQEEDALKADANKTPGLKSIGVLGLGVAATQESIENLRHYRYLTAEGDGIIDVALRPFAKSLPAANFTDVHWNERQNGDSIRHAIVDTYLSNATGEMPRGSRSSFSSKAVNLFKEVRAEVEADWPCITDVSLPTVKQFADAEVAVRIQGRPGDVRVPQGTVQFTYGGGVPFFGGGCNAAPIGSDGYARCIPSFRMAPGTYSVQVSVFPRVDGVFTWTTDLANDGIGTFTVTDQDGPEYSFEFRDAGATIPPQCQQYYASNYASPVSWSFLVSDFQQCTKGMKPQIRCVGVGCTLNRFFVTTTSVEIITTYQSVFSDSGSCPNPVSTQVHAGPTTYPGFNWGPVGSFDTINPYGSDFGYNETFNVYYLRNITNVVFYQPPYQGPYGTLCAATGHSVEFRVRIFDNLEKRYFSESFAVGTQ